MNKAKLEKLLTEALLILESFGLPIENMSQLRQKRMAKALLAVAGMTSTSNWKDAKSNDDNHRLRSRQILEWMNKNLGESISPGSYDDIRRKDLKLSVEAEIIAKAAGKIGAKENDGTRAYALNPQFAVQIRKYGLPEWGKSLPTFMAGKETLVDSLRKKRDLERIPVKLGDIELTFGPGEHNQLQKVIIEEFLPRFGHGAEVLYVGDAGNKFLHVNTKRLNELKFFEIGHGKLPDVLAYSKKKDWLYVIEAVDSANPISDLRKRTLEQLTKNCTAGLVFVTVFLTRAVFRKFAHDVAWETEVWIAEEPEHMIHYNGDKFLGPHAKN